MSCLGINMYDVEWTVKRTTTPSTYPVTLEEVKSHCRIDGEDEDSTLLAYIAAATHQAELICDRQLMTATYELRLDAFPDVIRLPKPPCQSVTSIAYVDSAGTTQTLSASNYSVDTFHEPARIIPAYGAVWPTTRGMQNDVIVTYEAGYASASAVPKNLKLGIIHLVAHWFENREPVSDGSMKSLPWVSEELIRSHWHGHIW